MQMEGLQLKGADESRSFIRPGLFNEDDPGRPAGGSRFENSGTRCK